MYKYFIIVVLLGFGLLYGHSALAFTGHFSASVELVDNPASIKPAMVKPLTRHLSVNGSGNNVQIAYLDKNSSTGTTDMKHSMYNIGKQINRPSKLFAQYE